MSPEAVVYMVRFEELSLKVCTHEHVHMNSTDKIKAK